MLEHILFDFDGTIADSRGIFLRVFNELAAKYKYRPFSAEELHHLSTISIQERVKKLGLPLLKIPRIIKDFPTFFHQHLPTLNPIEGIGEVLHGLKEEGFKLSILSSNSSHNIATFLLNHEITLFDKIISEKNLFGKHTSIAKYLKRNLLQPAEVLYVGDELRDIEACRKAGVKMIAVSWGYDSLELLQSGRPDFIAHQPADLMAIIQGMKSPA